MSQLQLLDSMLSDRVVVFGSLPPGGRDLDLLVRPPEHEALSSGLRAEGFLHQQGIWRRLGAAGAEVVEIKPATAWGLPPEELSDLYSESRLLPGCKNLARPAPHHALLILARRLVRAGGVLESRQRRRVEAALAEDPDAWEAASGRAPAWRASGALGVLESAYRSHRSVPVPARLAALVSEWRLRKGQRRQTVTKVVRAAVRPRKGFLVALSGLDGAGKSSQAACVRDALVGLGCRAVTVWPAIDAPSRTLPAAARLGQRLAALGSRPGGEGTLTPSAEEVGRSVRKHSRALTLAWSLLVTLRGAVRVARLTWPHLARGRVVVCDRYLLDSWVYLRHHYGGGGDYRLHVALLTVAAPRPRRAYLIEVSAKEAAARQPERTASENAERGRLYRELAPRLKVRPIDGERPRERICAEIVRDIWESLD